MFTTADKGGAKATADWGKTTILTYRTTNILSDLSCNCCLDGAFFSFPLSLVVTIELHYSSTAAASREPPCKPHQSWRAYRLSRWWTGGRKNMCLKMELSRDVVTTVGASWASGSLIVSDVFLGNLYKSPWMELTFLKFSLCLVPRPHSCMAQKKAELSILKNRIDTVGKFGYSPNIEFSHFSVSWTSDLKTL